MKPGTFTLTKGEQRVAILVVLALLIVAFVRYWRELSAYPAIKTTNPSSATATPFRSLDEDGQAASDEETDTTASKINRTPSPQFSP